MARRGWLVGIVAALVAASFVPGAPAQGRAHETTPVELAVLPLPKAQLGRAASSLSLARDSGLYSNYLLAPLSSTGFSFADSLDTFKQLGRLAGYALDYGDAYSGGSGITEIRTYVERYRTPAGAKKGLAFWRKDDEQVVRLDHLGGFTVAAHRFLPVPAVGTGRFAYYTKCETVHARPVRMVDERFTDGRYDLEVEVAWGSRASGSALASQLAKKLERRLHLALAGRLDARVPKLPSHPVPGHPPGGPDLSTLVLQPTDLAPGAANVDNRFYVDDPFAVSQYSIDFDPAGPYFVLGQGIGWYPSANEAAFRATYDEALATASVRAQCPRCRSQITSVDLDSIGHGDRATVIRLLGGSGSSIAVAFSRGQATDFVAAHSDRAQPPVSEVQALARSMAARLDPGLTG